MADSKRPTTSVPNDEATIVSRPRRDLGLVPGAVLGNTYRIDALLARGNMGAVYRATHVELGTTHAIKVLLPALADDPTMVQRLVEEGRKLARLRHEAIVEYEGLFRDARGLRYLVMEFAEGPSLAAILKGRRLEPDEVLRLRDRLAQGLAAAHERGIIHRGLSPENIILPHGDTGRAKLIDFGMAKALDTEATVIGLNFAAKSAYASPEQLGLFGGQVDLRSDIYSLGLVLANAAIGFGKTLDMGSSLAATLAAREHSPDLTPVPAELRAVIAPMLMPRPEDRPPSMRAVLPQLAASSHPVALPSAGAAAPVKRRLGLTLFAAAVSVIALTAAVLVFLFRSTIWPPSIETLKADLAVATTGYKCAAISINVAPDRSAEIVGHAASAADLDRLRRAVGGVYGIGKVKFSLREVAWPYCQVVDLLQPYTTKVAPDLPTVALTAGAAYTGERLALSLSMPRFDGYLFVDYFVQQGLVLHLLPNGRDRINIKPARNRFVLGRPPSLTCWTLADNPGEQLITVIASNKPLFADARPEVENAEPYLQTLSAALAKAPEVGAATLMFALQAPPYPNPAALCPGS